METETENETENETGTCHFCLKRCKPLRCSVCKTVYYCSRTCQKKDWRVHKRSCRKQQLENDNGGDVTACVASSPTSVCTEAPVTASASASASVSSKEKFHKAQLAAKASMELQNLLSGLSMQQATENFHRASDELERMISTTTATATRAVAAKGGTIAAATRTDEHDDMNDGSTEGRDTSSQNVTATTSVETDVDATYHRNKTTTSKEGGESMIETESEKAQATGDDIDQGSGKGAKAGAIVTMNNNLKNHIDMNHDDTDRGNESQGKGTSTDKGNEKVVSNRAIINGFEAAIVKEFNEEVECRKDNNRVEEIMKSELDSDVHLDSNYEKGTWNCAVEKLIHISTFAFILTPPPLPALQRRTENFNSFLPQAENKSRFISSRDCIKVEVKKLVPQQKKDRSRQGNIQTLIRVIYKKENPNMNTNIIHQTEEVLTTILLPSDIVSNEDDIMQSLHLMDKGLYITFRVQYDYDYGDDTFLPEAPLTPSEAIDNLQCRSCDQFLLRSTVTPAAQIQSSVSKTTFMVSDNYENEKENEGNDGATDEPVIKDVFRLPTGHWDEITDYLTCYEGQPNIDFSSVSNVALRGSAMEDSAIIVLNKQDLHNVCVLAIDGYGEHELDENDNSTSTGKGKMKEKSNDNGNDNKSLMDTNEADPLVMEGDEDTLFRGNRNWRDAVGGATLCCSVCCSVLGYASIMDPDTCRLLKHRLKATMMKSPSPQNDVNYGASDDHFRDNTCGSFIGKELIRFAETQAVFTFAVFGYDYAGDAHGNAYAEGCILLKVLSWNTTLAMNRVGRFLCAGTDSGTLDFRRVVKVICSETDAASLLEASRKHNENDPLTFRWGGADLCCPPNSRGRNSNAVMHTPKQRNERSEEDQKIDSLISTQASVNIYLSNEELLELRRDVEKGKEFISNEVSNATVVGFRIHQSAEVKTEHTSLSYLSL